MTVVPLPPSGPLASDGDAPLRGGPGPQEALSFSGALTGALGGSAAALERADAAERAFSAGRGGLQEMMLERAQADIALSVATAAASRAAQALTTILGMQV